MQYRIPGSLSDFGQRASRYAANCPKIGQRPLFRQQNPNIPVASPRFSAVHTWNPTCQQPVVPTSTNAVPPDRRTAVSWLLGGGIAASLASFFYPVACFLNPPQVAEASVDEVVAGKVQDLKPNSGRIVRFGTKPALLVRLNDTDWKAFSAVCTHLNCTVQYQESRREIWCACHNGTYDLDGRVASGPPPKPLDELAVKIRGEEVVISRRA